MSNTKEKIVEALDGKSKAQILATEFIEAEEELIKELSKLKNWGSECNCDETTEINLVFYGNSLEVATYCLECGGYINA